MLTEKEILEYENIDELINFLENQMTGGALTSDDVKWGLTLAGAFATWTAKKYKEAQKYPNELHQPMWVDGKIKIASFSGPRTNLIQRLKDGDKPISYTDEVSKLHDIMYQRASASKTRDEMRDLKSKADDIMLKFLEKGKEKKLDNKINIGIARLGISGRKKIQKYSPSGIFNWLDSKYTGDLETLSEDDTKIINDEYKKTIDSLNDQVGNAQEEIHGVQEVQGDQDIIGGSLENMKRKMSPLTFRGSNPRL